MLSLDLRSLSVILVGTASTMFAPVLYAKETPPIQSHCRVKGEGKTWTSVISLATPTQPDLNSNATALIKNTPPVKTNGQVAYRWDNAVFGGVEYATGLVWSPRHPESLFLRADGGGIWKLDRKRLRWTALMDNLPYKWQNLNTVDSIAVSPDDQNVLYVAAGASRWGSPHDVLKTTDGGKHWTRTFLKNERVEDVISEGNGADKQAGERLVCDPNQGKTLYFGSRNDGLFRSTDGASTWTSVASFPSRGAKWTGITFVTFDWKQGSPHNTTKTIYVGVHAGKSSDDAGSSEVEGAVYKSEDGGTTWRKLSGGAGTHASPLHGKIAMDGTLYVTYTGGGNNWSSQGGAGGVWKYKNEQWTNITPEGKPDVFCGLCPHPTDPNQVICATTYHESVIYHSKDAGATWKAYRYLPGNKPENSLVIDFAPAWELTPDWKGIQNVSDVIFDPLDPKIVWEADFSGPNRGTGVGTDQMRFSLFGEGREQMTCADAISPTAGAPLISGVWDVGGFRHERLNEIPKTTMRLVPRGGKGNWGETFYQDIFQMDANPQHPNDFVVAGGWQWNNTGDAAYSDNNGKTLREFPTKPFVDAKFGRIAQGVDPANVVWIPMGDRETPFYFTQDRGKTWRVSQGSPLGTVATDGVWSFYKLLAADRVQESTFYAYDRRDGHFYRSVNGGANWKHLSTLPKQAGAHFDIHRVNTNPFKARDVWIGIPEHGLFHSTNGGETWSRLTGVEWVVNFAFGKGKTGGKTPSLYLFGQIGGKKPTTPQTTDANLWRSDDLGLTWVRVNDETRGLASIASGMTGDMQVYGRVYVTTSQRGIFYGVPVTSALSPLPEKVPRKKKTS